MRTTVTLAPDVAAEVERLRRETGAGVSEVLNTLARRAMSTANDPAAQRTPYRQPTAPLGARLDVTNIGDVLDLLDKH